MERGFSEVFEYCRAKAPMPLIARLVMDRILTAEKVDAWFEASRDRQYKRDLLFSTAFELMNLVAVKVFTTTHAALREVPYAALLRLGAPGGGESCPFGKRV